MSKKRPTKRTVEDERKSKKFNSFILLIIPFLVAIGAYSRDSLFIRILESKDTYSVVRSTAMGGTVNTGFFRAYPSAFGELLAPIQMLIYLNIRNNGDFEQTVEGIMMEVGDNNSWQPVRCLIVGSGIYSALGTEGLKESTLLDFSDNNLLDNLGRGRIPTKEVVSGWLFLEFPKEYWKTNVLKSQLRISIFSGFGENERHIIAPVNLPENANSTRSASIKPAGIKKDLSKLEILSEGDLYKRFEAQRKK